MEKVKVLFIEQEITPFTEDTYIATISRYLPQGIIEKGKEIRVFTPKYGCINERRNRLHDVIRLSGLNIIINNSDHPLIIKVTNIPTSKLQVYFIDNDEFFSRKFLLKDKNDKYYRDNDERSIFFCRSVLETVKKLSWVPDIIHCHGWFTSLIPIYLKKAFKYIPLYSETKVIYSVYDEDTDFLLSKDFANKIKIDGISNEDCKHYENPDFINLTKSAIDFSDGIIIGSKEINPEIQSYINTVKKPTLDFQPIEFNKYIDAYSNFYDDILISESILTE